MILLDTDVVIDLLRGHVPMERLRAARRLHGPVAVSAIVRSELVYGIRLLPDDHHRATGLHRFLAEIGTVPWGDRAADVYVEVRHRLELLGQVIGDKDMMIAAHAIALGATLVTNNTRHFARIAPPLRLENWVADS